ncbi:hypothetical protein Pyn_17072 [Prunus yedoensis var. nudiflora]|uniref:Carrier domain-containing protein n=1 Tax=Prunus yedoensis var. nudiflora TaxID=2094558 RepID=A0A314ZM00_PRUYE|nr:hypothetical protein Pyn_17072 [Prunus yedoensis var. nudiflora]
MDPGKSMEDQFSRMHPCLPMNTRIGIVGAGPSGLSAAYALVKLGYSNVTVLEKYHTVGGMCESVKIEGNIYDLGGQVLAANSAPVIFHLAKETGSELEEMDSHKLALIDNTTGEYQDIKVADDYVSVISLTLELQDKAASSGRIGVHAVSEYASDLTPVYLERHGFKSVPKSVAYGYTASGYGYIQDMPYAYIHEFTRTSMAGKIRRFKGGYTSLWKKISESLPIVHCNTEVLEIRRYSDCVSVDVKSCDGEVKVIEFDKIIISGSFPLKNGRTYRSLPSHPAEHESEVMEMGDVERELFSKVQTIDYYTTVLKIKGIEHMPMGFYYFDEYISNPATIGHPVAMQRFFADTDIFLFWSYGNSVNITGPTVTKLAIDAAKLIGGEVKDVVLQRRFKYFPHVGSQEMMDGFYEKLESQLQGFKNTYYVGGLMAFELTERNSSYAMGLVCKHFANDNSTPIFPYAKSLFALQQQWGGSPKSMAELPGVEFPNLPSLDGYLKHWGAHRVNQNRILYTWISEEGEVVSQRTYAELHANASCIAQKLLTCRKPVIRPGDRVLLVHVPGLDFVDAFFGCLRAKVLPVPVLPPDPLQRGGQALLKIENIAKSCGAVAILSTISYHWAVQAGSVKNMISLTGKNQKSKARWPNLPWLHTDSWIKNSKNVVVEGIADEFEPEGDDVCFLQFTSGSTGDAKGVMITHGGLIHNVKLMRKRYKSTSKTVLVSWLPQYHDMGLIGGLFTALVSGGTAILFSPLTFIRNPLLWLQIMSKYQATHSAGPNFAFELVVRRLESDKNRKFDLSSMTFLMVAAEPVRQKTVKRFVELTRPFGKPIMVDWQGRVCCGYVNPDDEDVNIRIVDPESGEELKEAGKEGEIWISSPSAGIGYWGREELSQKTYRNKLPDHPGRNYTRTGDLGRVIDRKLFITGRIKDLIIVAGRNIYSADVEKTVESASELVRPGCCAVIPVPVEILSTKGITVSDSSDQVGLVVIAEVRDGKPVGKDVVEQIQARVAEEHGVSVASVKMIRPKTISKTTSGKIKRFECLQQFTDGTLNVVPEPIITRGRLLRSFTTGTCKEGITPRPQLVRSSSPPSPKISNKEIVDFLKRLVSEQTGILINKISNTESLVSYGIDSIGVVRAAQKLSDFLGVPVGAVDIFTATCIADLASFSENLVMNSQPQLLTTPSNVPQPDTGIDSAELVMEIPETHHLPNYALNPEVSIWSMDFFKWWALYKAHEVASKFWRSICEELCSSIDITDPSLVSIGDGAVIAEGALIQSHEVKNGVLSFLPIRIGQNSSVGPYAVVQKGTILGEEDEVMALQKCGSKSAVKAKNLQNGKMLPNVTRKLKMRAIYQFIGIYIVGLLVLSFLTSALTHLISTKQEKKTSHFRTWLCHRITIACHLDLLSSCLTEAFCMYLRLLGAKVGKHCSIRAINPISDPKLISLGSGVHLGDFSRIIAGFYSFNGFISGKIEVQDNSVVGSESVVLPGSVIQQDVILGALSVAPVNSVLQAGGVYIGSQTPIMIKNTMHSLDDRIEEMDIKYKKIWEGYLKIYDDIKGLPDHKIFCPGKSYPVIIRHSNSLSADDDARIDARGAAIRILSDETKDSALFDLTLKTGKAFYARTIADFATWLVCGLPAREEYVKRAPMLFRFTDGQEMYVKFKLRPSDEKFSEEAGKVEPIGILPPDTDFKSRVNDQGGVRYVFQLQVRPVPHDESARDIALDCTKPWNDAEFPYIDVGEININQMLSAEESEQLDFNPFLQCHEVGVIRASSCSQSASIDHGRSLIYEICQHLRNGEPLPEAWKIFYSSLMSK